MLSHKVSNNRCSMVHTIIVILKVVYNTSFIYFWIKPFAKLAVFIWSKVMGWCEGIRVWSLWWRVFVLTLCLLTFMCGSHGQTRKLLTNVVQAGLTIFLKINCVRYIYTIIYLWIVTHYLVTCMLLMFELIWRHSNCILFKRKDHPIISYYYRCIHGMID